jgi:UDP-GlcNAc:undecaprenyl-phosphate GlcNAc-1-phosphate transferase
MLIGFVLGVLAISGSTKEAATVATAPLIAIWTILIFDSVAAFARRALTGRSIYVGDREHIHHRFLIHGLSVRQTALAVAGLCAFTSVAAVVSSWIGHDVIGLLVAAAVVVGLTVCGHFGDTEFKLLRQRLTNAGKLALRPILTGNGSIRSSFSLRGSTRWNDDWSALEEAAERYGLTELRLSLCIPAIHEHYYGSWRRREPLKDQEAQWTIERPLRWDGEKIGAVGAKGLMDHCDGDSSLVRFLEFLEELDGQINEKIAIALNPTATAAVFSALPAKDPAAVGVQGVH